MSLTRRLGEVEYEWTGSFGQVIRSFERKARVGDVRMILGILFQCQSRYRRGPFRLSEVSWTPCDDSLCSIEWIRQFKRKFFDCEFINGI